MDIKQVGRELGVRYVLEGSVRTAGGRIRLTGQLIEAATGSHLWADRFDGAADDIFDLQDRITASVVGLIAPTVERAEIERAKRKPTEQLDSYDLYLRGMAILRGQRTSSEARSLFLKAIEKDAEYGAAHSMVAWTLLMEQSISGAKLSEENRAEAIRHARLAASLAPGDSFALARAGHVLTYIGREYDLGSSLVTEAVALNPNLSTAWYSKGWIDLMRGEPKDAVDSFDKALRFSPLDTLRGSCLNGRAFSFFQLEHYHEGCESAERALQVYTDVHTLCALIINRVRAGLVAETSDAVKLLLRLQPSFRASHSIDAFPVRPAEFRQRMLTALTDAGIPP